jgi:hypothetical protein
MRKMVQKWSVCLLSTVILGGSLPVLPVFAMSDIEKREQVTSYYAEEEVASKSLLRNATTLRYKGTLSASAGWIAGHDVSGTGSSKNWNTGASVRVDSIAIKLSLKRKDGGTNSGGTSTSYNTSSYTVEKNFRDNTSDVSSYHGSYTFKKSGYNTSTINTTKYR